MPSLLSRGPAGTARLPARGRLKCTALVIIGRPGEEQKNPDDPVGVVRRCLQAMRMKDRALLKSFFAPGLVPNPSFRCCWPDNEHPEILDGGVFVGLMDVGTRRLAPNHILRRSEVRSVLRLGNSAQLRVVVCARGGEEAVLHFDLSLDKRSRWVVNAITRDAESDAEVPTGLHPRHSPESVVIAQLQALQANDAAYAARYAVQDSARGNSVSFLGEVGPISAVLSKLAVEGFRLGQCCLADEHNHLQQVEITSPGGYRAELVLHLTLDGNSCWGLAGISRRARIEPVMGQPVLMQI